MIEQLLDRHPAKTLIAGLGLGEAPKFKDLEDTIVAIQFPLGDECPDRRLHDGFGE